VWWVLGLTDSSKESSKGLQGYAILLKSSFHALDYENLLDIIGETREFRESSALEFGPFEEADISQESQKFTLASSPVGATQQ
jgi:hypothetical protein